MLSRLILSFFINPIISFVFHIVILYYFPLITLGLWGLIWILPYKFDLDPTTYWIYNIFRGFFSNIIKRIDTIKDPEFVKIEDEQCMLAISPHGTVPLSVFVYEKNKSVMFASSVLYHLINFFYLVLYTRGGIVPADYKNIIHAIKLQKQIIIYPGGVKEALLTNSDKSLYENIYRKHYGFAKIAFENNLPLVPVVCKNEEKILYDYFPSLTHFSYKYFKIPIVISLFNPSYPGYVVRYYGKPLFAKDFNNHKEMQHAFYDQVKKMCDELQNK